MINPREAFRAADRVPFDQELKSEVSLVLWDVHGAERAGVGFGVGLVAARAAVTAQAVPVLSEALAFDLPRSASHCLRCFYLALHGSIIQRLLARVKS